MSAASGIRALCLGETMYVTVALITYELLITIRKSNQFKCFSRIDHQLISIWFLFFFNSSRYNKSREIWWNTIFSVVVSHPAERRLANPSTDIILHFDLNNAFTCECDSDEYISWNCFFYCILYTNWKEDCISYLDKSYVSYTFLRVVGFLLAHRSRQFVTLF